MTRAPTSGVSEPRARPWPPHGWFRDASLQTGALLVCLQERQAWWRACCAVAFWGRSFVAPQIQVNEHGEYVRVDPQTASNIGDCVLGVGFASLPFQRFDDRKGHARAAGQSWLRVAFCNP